MSADLKVQQVAIAQAIEAERLHSASVYPALLAAWKARGGRLTSPGAGGGNAGPDTTFVACQPLPFDAEAQIVGPAGGEFDFGPHHLSVPAGALAWPVAMGVMVPSSNRTEVSLLPHGIQFAAPVTLTLTYAHCDVAPTHRVGYLGYGGAVLQWISSVDDLPENKIAASLDHFSLYAIAY